MNYEISVWAVLSGKFTCTFRRKFKALNLNDMTKEMQRLGAKYGVPGPRVQPINGTYVVSVYKENKWTAQVQANQLA